MFIVPSTAASLVRYPLGYHVGALGPRPAKLLELYELETCPYCRKVREALTMLDLDVLVKPTPHGGTRYRPEAIALGGKKQFPLLVDPNAGVELYESGLTTSSRISTRATAPASRRSACDSDRSAT